jgi:hypothetical protein
MELSFLGGDVFGSLRRWDFQQRECILLYWRRIVPVKKCGSNDRPDKEKIFVWHVLPFDKESTASKEDEHLKILRNDKAARVIIYCMCFLQRRLIYSPWNLRACGSGTTT